jgi:hypothetical protein
MNGVALTRIIDRNGIPSLAFRVDSSGRIVPSRLQRVFRPGLHPGRPSLP